MITQEEAISKGVRRMVALTGPEATKAIKKTEYFENEINKLKSIIASDKDGKDSKDHVKKIIEINDDISKATVPYVKKDALRTILNGIKKTLDDKERAAKAAVAALVVEKAKELCQASVNAPYLIHQLHAFNNTKAIDAALKQVRTLSPDTSALFVSVDPDSKKIFCLISVSKAGVEKGLKANEWIQEVSSAMGGKGGGKIESAQASGPNYENVDEVLQLAKKFAASKLD